MTALEKLLKGEVLTDEEKNSLTPEQLAEGKKKELESIEGLRAERRRLEGLKADEEQKTVADFSKKTLSEYTQKAENQVFAQLAADGIELTEEKKSAIRATRIRLDDGHVTYDAIVDDFLAAAAAVDRTSLFGAKRKNVELEKNAAQFNAQGAGANGSGGPGGGNGDKQFSQEVWDWVAESRKKGIEITPEQAQIFLTKGQRRVY